jgi:hypothetical protein
MAILSKTQQVGLHIENDCPLFQQANEEYHIQKKRQQQNCEF